MEATSDQSACTVTMMGPSKLRYPLRSASKSKDAKPPPAAVPPAASASKRGRPSPAVSKSVNTLDFSGKTKSAKPPRRLSIPTKPAASPHPAAAGSITPVPESRSKRPNHQGKSETPLTEVSKSLARKKFSVISSVSYWLTQIKLSESASKHSISLGFFKLALEAGCEPLDRVREELKSYITRHKLVVELGDSVKELLQNYNIVEDLENLSLSGSPKEEAHKSDNDVPSTAGAGNLKPKSLNTDTAAVVTSKKDNVVEKKQPTAKKGAYSRNKAKSVPSKDGKDNNTENKPQKNKIVSKKSAKEPMAVTGGETDHSPDEEEVILHEDKENMAW